MTNLVNRKKRRWNTLVFFLLSGLITASWGTRIPEIQQKLNLNNAAWGRTLMAMPFGLLTGTVAGSWFIMRFGAQKIMVISCITAALLLCLMGWSSSAPELMTALFFYGMFRTLLNLSMNTDSISVQKLYEKPVISTFHGIWSLACFAAAGLATIMIIYEVAPPLHFLFLVMICILTLYSIKNLAAGNIHIVPDKKPLFVMPDRYLFLLGMIAFCTLMAEGVMFEWGVNYFEQVVKPGKGLVTAGYSAFVIMMAAGRLSGDFLIHRFSPLSLLLMNGLLMTAGFLLSSLFPSFWPATLGFLLVGTGDSIVIPLVYLLASRNDKMPPAYAIASVSLIGSLGFLAGPILMGSISQTFGMPTAFGLMAFITSMVTLFSLMAKNRNRAEKQ